MLSMRVPGGGVGTGVVKVVPQVLRTALPLAGVARLTLSPNKASATP